MSGNTVETHPANSSRFPALDGIRAIAFLWVFGSHYLGLPWGWAGVDVFFVLSGFLITGILFDTRDAQYRVRNFYLRRTLRIFPLYYALFLLLLLVEPVLRWDWNWVWLAWPAYLGNWVRFLYSLLPVPYLQAVSVAHLTSRTFPKITLFFGHFWSLCIEEQFYLFWPWVVFWVKDRRRLMYICVAVVVAGPFVRMATPHVLPNFMMAEAANFWFMPVRIDALLLGGLAALVRRGSHARTMLVAARCGFVLCCLAILVWAVRTPGALSLSEAYPYPTGVDTWGFTFTQVFGLCLIVMALEYGSVTFRVLNVSFLRWLGRVSYGAYLFHDIPHPLYERVARHYLVHWQMGTAVLGFAGTCLLSWASFEWFESRFIERKDRWTR